MVFLGTTLSIVAVLANSRADDAIAKLPLANHQSSTIAPNRVPGVLIECSPVALTFEVGGREKIGHFNGCQTQPNNHKNPSSGQEASSHE